MSHPPGPERRAAIQHALGSGTFDVLVIGGGIIGISTAWTAARAGFRVALVDTGDFAGATSSASTKLVHGGLRYLQTRQARLVAENHRERRKLAHLVAPHLVTPRPFVVPIYRGGPHGAAKLGAGVFAYSALSAFTNGPGKVITPHAARALVPDLHLRDLRGAAVYTDHQMNDSRLAIMTLRAATAAGATVMNHARVVGLRVVGGQVVGADLEDALTDIAFAVSARRVVNATGPWIDHVRRLEDPAAEPSVVLSKGVHVVARAAQPWLAGLTIPVDRYRVTFAIPWEDQLLLGTTDEVYDGDPADVRATSADVAQVLRETSQAVTVAPDDITYTFAGLRVLPRTSGDSSATPRETVVSEGPHGMLSVAGGKWTTYRQIGGQVVDRLGASAPKHDTPLPGFGSTTSVATNLLAMDVGFTPEIARHLATHYGTLAHELAALVLDDPQLGEPVHPDGPDIWAQVHYAADHEWAETVDDVVKRRTTLALRGFDTELVRTRIDDLLRPAPVS